MKVLFALMTLLAAAPVLADTVSNVTICGASCNTESLGIINHDLTQTGTIYYAKASSTTVGYTLACLSEAQTLPTLGFRVGENDETSDISVADCSRILNDEYFGKTVDLTTTKVDGKSYVTDIQVK